MKPLSVSFVYGKRKRNGSKIHRDHKICCPCNCQASAKAPNDNVQHPAKCSIANGKRAQTKAQGSSCLSSVVSGIPINSIPTFQLETDRDITSAMSIPAVLYDHVPVDDLEEYGYVSTVIHQASAPPEEGEGVRSAGSGDDVNINSFQSAPFIESRNSYNMSYDHDDTSINASDVDNDILQDMDLDEHPMETIIEDIDFDYVLIPIPPPIILPGEEDDTENTDLTMAAAPTKKRKIYQTLQTYQKSLFGTVTNSKHRIYVSKSVSKCASGSRALLRPLQSYARDWMASSAIYSSYDWVSETIVDASGNRLILPGSCVSLDAQDSNPRQKDSEGTLIVPAGTEEASNSLPASSPSSSIWASKTIMVSAHDLLAIKHDQRMQLGDDPRPLSLFEAIDEEEEGNSHQYRYYYRDQEYNAYASAMSTTTTRTITQQWACALWKLAEHKARIWYFISRSYLRRSLKNAQSRFIYSQQYLIRFYQSKNRQVVRLLAMLSNHRVGNINGHADGIAYDENRIDVWDTDAFMVSNTSTQLLSHRSVLDQKTSDEILEGCDFGARNLECTSSIEMPTHTSKRRKEYATFY